MRAINFPDLIKHSDKEIAEFLNDEEIEAKLVLYGVRESSERDYENWKPLLNRQFAEIAFARQVLGIGRAM